MKKNKLFTILIVLITALACLTMTSCDNSIKNGENGGNGNDQVLPDMGDLETDIPGASKIPGINTPKNDNLPAPTGTKLKFASLVASFEMGTPITDVLYAKMSSTQYMEFVKDIKLMNPNLSAKAYPESGIFTIGESRGNMYMNYIQKGDGTWIMALINPGMTEITAYKVTKYDLIPALDVTNTPYQETITTRGTYTTSISWSIKLTESEKATINTVIKDAYTAKLNAAGYKLPEDSNNIYPPNTYINNKGETINYSPNTKDNEIYISYTPSYNIATDDYSANTFYYLMDNEKLQTGVKTTVNYTKMNDQQLKNLLIELAPIVKNNPKDTIKAEMKAGTIEFTYEYYGESSRGEYCSVKIMTQDATGTWKVTSREHK